LLLDPQGDPLGISTRTEQFTVSKNLLTSGADALERIISSYKEVGFIYITNTFSSFDYLKIAELAGHTNRVYTMLHVFDECAHGNYQRTPIVAAEGHTEHLQTVIKRKVSLNQRAGQL
jgi:hypothetical protein